MLFWMGKVNRNKTNNVCFISGRVSQSVNEKQGRKGLDLFSKGKEIFSLYHPT